MIAKTSIKAKKHIKFKRTSEHTTPNKSSNITPRNPNSMRKENKAHLTPKTSNKPDKQLSVQAGETDSPSSMNLVLSQPSLKFAKSLNINFEPLHSVADHSGDHIEVLDEALLPPVPEKISAFEKQSAKSKQSMVSSKIKNKSLNRLKRANLDAGQPFINEAELVKNYFEMKGKIGESEVDKRFENDIWHQLNLSEKLGVYATLQNM